MRFHVGAIPETGDFDCGPPWRALREPGLWLMQFLALPIGIGMCAGVAGLWFALTPVSMAARGSPLLAAAFFLAIVPIHEGIHALVHPHYGRTDRTVLGAWPARGVFFAHFDGELTRGRFIAILVMPLAVISLGTLALCAALQVAPRWLAFASTLNALLACGDVLGILLLLWQVPRGAIVRNQGWRTYWRFADESGAQVDPRDELDT